MPSAWILDVGHGSSAVIEAGSATYVVDGGRGGTLARLLESIGRSSIDAAFVSHADADHLGGISILLSDPNFAVQKVFVNPDSRGSELWLDFISEMQDARSRGTDFSLELTSDKPGTMESDPLRIEVLAPRQEAAIRTPTGVVESGPLSPNALSAVIRVTVNDQPKLLLAGDLDAVGLNELLKEGVDLSAELLVFPHHGGRPGAGADPVAFTETVMKEVNPSLVVFSIGRGVHSTPRPDIVETVRRMGTTIHVACTQLSEHCSASMLESDFDHLTEYPAKGKDRNVCCAGTMRIDLDEVDLTYEPKLDSHAEFLDREVATPLCRL